MFKYAFLLFGALFGFLLSRAGATSFDFYATLFLFNDPLNVTPASSSGALQLMLVIGAGVAVGMIGMTILRKAKAQKALLTKDTLSFKGKPFNTLLVPGSLIFGIGWGLAAACPGTAMAMLGEGKMAPLFTILGVLIGTWLFGVVKTRQTAGQQLQAHPPANNAS